MTNKIILLLFLLSPNFLFSQVQVNNNWIFGRGFRAALVNFSDEGPIVTNLDKELDMDSANASISNSNGDLLFYTNGCHVYNREYEIMENGDSISSYGSLHNFTCSGGSVVSQSVMILPNYSNECEYFIIHNDLRTGGSEAYIYYSTVDMTKDEGLGAVVKKDDIVVADSISFYGLTATQHANGKDWWFVFPKEGANCYFIMLLTAEGLELKETQCIGYKREIRIPSGAVTFSPDGSTYANFHYLNGLILLEFDNQLGQFSNPSHFDFDFVDTSYWSGVAISPNSELLYATTTSEVFQFDLTAEDVKESRVEVASLIDTSDHIRFVTRFHMMATGPDDKIYIGGLSQYNHLHTIHQPNKKGLACELEQYALKLDTFPSFSSWGVPNIPHFPDDFVVGSCDSVYVSTSDQILGNEKSIEVAVFPNPASGDLLNIEIKGASREYTLVLTDLLGVVQQSFDVYDIKTQVNIGAFEPGIYIYQIFVEGSNVGSGKLVKSE